MATNLQFIKSASGSSVSSLSVTDCFSDKYDVYKIIVPNYENTTGTNNSQMRLIDSGSSTITAAEYDNATLILDSATTFSETGTTSNTVIRYFPVTNASYNVGVGTSIYIYNPYDSSSYTFLQWQGTAWSGTKMYGYKGISVHKSAEQITRFTVFASGGTMDNFDVSVYGVK